MQDQIEHIKSIGLKTLPTLQGFLEQQHNKLIKTTDDYTLYRSLLKFNEAQKKIPKITDFINFDGDGNPVVGNKPIFKGWKVCEESSTETIKVPKLEQNDNEYRMYFNTKDGVIIASTTHMCDQTKYSDLAYFFEGKLKLS